MSQTEIRIVPANETFNVVKSAVNKMVDFIRVTYGPAGKKLMISKIPYSMIVDDGVQGARDFELMDPAENFIVKVVREVAVRTNDRVGDGTTSSLIMLQAIINEVARRTRFDGRKIEIELKKALEEIKEKLQKEARQIKTKDELKKVALVSFDNESIAEMIADTYHKLGKDGVITIDRSQTMETSVEISDGIKLERGYISPYMITNPERMEAVVEKPLILITDYRLTEANDLLPLMNKMAEAGKNRLVVIAENVEQNALATMVINLPSVINPQTRKPGTFYTLAINAPSSENRKVLLEDLAMLTGAKMFTESKGDKLQEATIADLGTADRIISRRDESVIIGPKGKKADIKTAIDQLRKAVEGEKDERAKKELVNRLARFTNTVAVIKVGAATDNEQKALKYKVEDAVNAVKVAYKGGVVCGGGLSLARLKTSSPLLNEALKYPSQQLMENMGLDSYPDVGSDEAYNVVTGKTGKFMDVGVVDPVDVLIAGVESAVSIASMLLTSEGMVVEFTPKTQENQQ